MTAIERWPIDHHRSLQGHRPFRSAAAVGEPDQSHPDALAEGEAVEARVVAVAHEVVYGVATRSGTRVVGLVAEEDVVAVSLVRRVDHRVTGSRAAVLEGV